MQHTLAKEVEFKGVGLHSGVETTLVIKPAAENTGIVFIRRDKTGFEPLPALYSNVVDTRNCTCLGNKDGDIVSTIEHLMATLSVLKIDNAVVEVSAPEMPILDGAAAMFWQKLSAAGVKEQSAKRHYLKVLKKVAFEDGKGASVCLEPAENFEVHFEIEFPSKIVGHQVFDATVTPDVFVSEIAPCRTFCEKYQIDYLRSIGLIKGGSLENAVVLDGEQILNPGGFKVKNECVNHKVLDAIGDMYTAGLPLLGRLTALKSGHYHNNQLLRALFADKSLYEIV
jgi:UDP-3-O-[3-hydroxymyristoyl] N-acetylglucosamine deacetylase